VSLKPLVFSLNDSLMLLAPRGWKSVELKVVKTPLGLQVAQLETAGEGATAPKPRPPLHFDPKDEATRLSEGLTELHAALAGKWDPGTVRIERPGEDFVDWKLLKADGSVAWFTRLDHADHSTLLMTDALFDALTGSSKAFDDLQAQLGERLGAVTGFAFDTGTFRLRLDRPRGAIELGAQIVGAYLPETFTWVWGWSDPEAKPEAVDRVRRFCLPNGARPEGLSALWRPSFHCDEGFAWAVAGSVVVGIGARGLFRGELPDGSGVVLFALMELPAATLAS
jgi:hypothetical protein